MLKTLIVENYALIESLRIDFHSGLNIITGETGTGKSIIIGALGLILGDRAKTDIIRQGAEKALVEAVLSVPKSISSTLADEIAPPYDELLIRREVYSNGRNRCFVNDSPVTLSILADLGNLLIDLHGQHEHQALFRIENHLNYLDNYESNNELLDIVVESYNSYLSCLRELNEIKNRENELKNKEQLLSFQVQEIQRVDPKSGEDIDLDNQERILRNAEKLHESLNFLENLLYDGEGCVVEQLSEANRHLIQYQPIDDRFNKWAEECDSARISVQELFHTIQAFVNQIDFNADHLEEIRTRLSALTQLKKKYGGSLDEVLSFFTCSKNELKQIETLDETIQKKTEELSAIQKAFSDYCLQLSESRKNNALELSHDIVRVLSELGLQHAKVNIQLTQKEKEDGPVLLDNKTYAATQKGIDHAEFMISLNAGENPKPLRQIASGGEISRIMLALKTVMAETDQIPILVFDEIDTGISGRIARVVGKNLKEVSRKHQIICITHLPQIASLGDKHFTVMKEMSDGRTRTIVHSLSEQDRVVEIAKLLGGETITDNTLQNARELLQ